jgi:hypothetical protein
MKDAMKEILSSQNKHRYTAGRDESHSPRFTINKKNHAAVKAASLPTLSMSLGLIITPPCVWMDTSVSLLQETHFHCTLSSHVGHSAIWRNSPPHALQDAISLGGTL